MDQLSATFDVSALIEHPYVTQSWHKNGIDEKHVEQEEKNRAECPRRRFPHKVSEVGRAGLYHHNEPESKETYDDVHGDLVPYLQAKRLTGYRDCPCMRGLSTGNYRHGKHSQ